MMRSDRWSGRDLRIPPTKDVPARCVYITKHKGARTPFALRKCAHPDGRLGNWSTVQSTRSQPNSLGGRQFGVFVKPMVIKGRISCEISLNLADKKQVVFTKNFNRYEN